MKDILLLHGAIGAKEQLEPLAAMLNNDFNVHLLDLPGHGGVPFPSGGYSMDGFADAVLKYLDEQDIKTISFFGYSMGGYVALLFAGKYPQRVEKVITLASKLYWDETVAAKEVKMLNPAIIEEKLPAFAKELEERHAPLNWKEQLLQTQQLLIDLGNRKEPALQYQHIAASCLLMLGDRDKMVTLVETINAYDELSNASLAILPKTGHPIEKADLSLLQFHVNRFMKE